MRDRLCLVIQEHQLDTALVKAYALDFCGASALKEAPREMVEKFVEHLAERSERDRDNLLGQLNSYVMSIHEHLPRQIRYELREVGWTKGVELAKLARRQGQRFGSATFMHKALHITKEEFRREVEKESTGKDSELSELIYFKFYKIQVSFIEQAIETAARMPGSDKARGYCLEMICADFLTVTNLEGSNPQRR